MPLLPKGASIFLSMTLQRLLRRWEKKARTASTPAKDGILKYSKMCSYTYSGQSRMQLPFLGLSCSYIFLSHFTLMRSWAAIVG